MQKEEIIFCRGILGGASGTGLFEAAADNVLNGVDSDEGIFVDVVDGVLDMADFKTGDDTFDYFFRLTGVGTDAGIEGYAVAEDLHDVLGNLVR